MSQNGWLQLTCTGTLRSSSANRSLVLCWRVSVKIGSRYGCSYADNPTCIRSCFPFCWYRVKIEATSKASSINDGLVLFFAVLSYTNILTCFCIGLILGYETLIATIVSIMIAQYGWWMIRGYLSSTNVSNPQTKNFLFPVMVPYWYQSLGGDKTLAMSTLMC